ncbi:DUF2809 domain-containing protein [Bernardetia sp.]|uniref:ribosomal maturation YjgA family protein n=1 Tax=Bernardetia sp. TaxID=1937974 RepID=UPI0025C448B8|nr:DUF2809 domain-containing protein [Bernardetia sp.]
MSRNRTLYFLLSIAIVCIGLLSRTETASLFITSHFGDYLYSILIFLIFGWIFKNVPTYKILIITLCFCYGIELLQLYQPAKNHWFNSLRNYKLTQLFLGNHFKWQDIVYYTFGGMSCYFLEQKFTFSNHKKSKQI